MQAWGKMLWVVVTVVHAGGCAAFWGGMLLAVDVSLGQEQVRQTVMASLRQAAPRDDVATVLIAARHDSAGRSLEADGLAFNVVSEDGTRFVAAVVHNVYEATFSRPATYNAYLVRGVLHGDRWVLQRFFERTRRVPKQQPLHEDFALTVMVEGEWISFEPGFYVNMDFFYSGRWFAPSRPTRVTPAFVERVLAERGQAALGPPGQPLAKPTEVMLSVGDDFIHTPPAR